MSECKLIAATISVLFVTTRNFRVVTFEGTW